MKKSQLVAKKQSAVSRFFKNENGPVQVTQDMAPAQKVVVRAANATVIKHQTETSKRAPYFKWTPEQRFMLGKLRATQGPSTALKEAKKINPNANESALRKFKKDYLSALKENPGLADDNDGSLSHAKRGGYVVAALSL